jgi:uncharacterized membrane protein YfcA
MCSLLGIGGGELMGPLLLGMGVMPQVRVTEKEKYMLILNE